MLIYNCVKDVPIFVETHWKPTYECLMLEKRGEIVTLNKVEALLLLLLLPIDFSMKLPLGLYADRTLLHKSNSLEKEESGK